ncbi:MAG TPA: hypothetical protein VJO35_13255 [Terriglobales bacterium]|nr:hypothetical protein [Terriglobales bacterium]
MNNFRSHPAKSALVVGFLLIATGFIINAISHHLSHSRHSSDKPISGSSPVSNVSFNAAAGSDPRVIKLMMQYRLTPQAAIYIAQAKTQLISQTETSVHYAQTFSNDLKADTTITIVPDQHYTPTQDDLARAERTHTQIYNLKFSATSDGENKERISLQYFVPYSNVPSDLKQRIHARSAASAAHFFDLVPSAWAQEGGGGNMGMNVATDTTVEVTKEILKQTAEHGELSKEFPVPLSRLGDILKAFKLEQEQMAWMAELDELEDCARHPTNPLTQQAYNQDPSYGDQIVHGVTQGRADVTAMTGMRFVNLATAVATDLAEGPVGAATTPISSYNDETLKDLAENRVSETKKGVTDCDKEMTFGNLRPMHAVLEYSYNKTEFGIEEKRTAGGEFDLNTQMGGLEGEGTGKFKIERKQVQPGPNACAYGYKGKGDGDAKIAAEAGGTPYGGVLELHLTTDLNLHESGMVPDGQHCSEQTRDEMRNYNFGCRFDRLDLVHGGTFSHFQDGDGHGTCTIELTRK